MDICSILFVCKLMDIPSFIHQQFLVSLARRSIVDYKNLSYTISNSKVSSTFIGPIFKTVEFLIQNIFSQFATRITNRLITSYSALLVTPYLSFYLQPPLITLVIIAL